MHRIDEECAALQRHIHAEEVPPAFQLYPRQSHRNSILSIQLFCALDRPKPRLIRRYDMSGPTDLSIDLHRRLASNAWHPNSASCFTTESGKGRDGTVSGDAAMISGSMVGVTPRPTRPWPTSTDRLSSAGVLPSTPNARSLLVPVMILESELRSRSQKGDGSVRRTRSVLASAAFPAACRGAITDGSRVRLPQFS